MGGFSDHVEKRRCCLVVSLVGLVLLVAAGIATGIYFGVVKNADSEPEPVSGTEQAELSEYTVNITKLSSIFIPSAYTPEAEYVMDQDAAEQMAFDAANKILYSVGYINVHVIDMTDVSNMTILYKMSVPDTEVTDVEVCGNYVYVAFDNRTRSEDGFINIYRLYDKVQDTMQLVRTIRVGTLPDMIQLTSDCSKLIAAVEAEPYDDPALQRLVDNPGGVAIIEFNPNPEGTYTNTFLGFEQFDAHLIELSKQGVRQVYAENGNPFSNDVEPEYIALSNDESKAYVVLQENNAVAVVDLVQKSIVGVHGLGFKTWSGQSLIDVSDRDGGITMRNWPIYGMYQPDSIKVYEHGGQEFLITANEGDSKDYQYFTEEDRVKNLQLSDIFENDPSIRSSLQQDNKLGRLKVSTTMGKNTSTGLYDALYSFGARSFSIWRTDTMEQVYDSGDDISHRIAMLRPDIFNADIDAREPLNGTFDTRSDDKGPETESIATGHFNDVTLLFIGNERPGTISVYSIDERLESIKPRFETLLVDIPRSSDTWGNLYTQQKLAMLDPEDIRFVPASESPNGKSLLLATGSVSGTISVYEVEVYY